VATGIPVREWCDHADTVSVCSSKGLGAPVGSLLAGDEETIREARRARKAFGGGMRQAGVIAAGSLYAFEHHIDRLAEDHERAKRLAAGLEEAGYRVQTPETNIVLVEVGEADRFLQTLAREGVLVTPRSASSVRFCTHLDVGDEEVEAAIEATSRITTDTLQRWR
jgi:threonine aldolase